ncbi:hypothetical protein GOP47_0008055 [Adiantum capillus-veneris]|uniref:X8 domain-containing protein n=1 Tax=Adiantum capillus-veneris TaxID=13818 RepID=A0A9D4UXH9_ADICA|nr:hypothetical protein GOP47_0008055 [Adiantum capillus-veneris]
MLKDNNFNKVKLFDTDENTLKALAGTDMEVMVAIPNKDLAGLQDADSALTWVEDHVKRYIFDGGVNIKYVGVANEPFLTSYNGTYVPLTFPALQNVQVALNKLDLGTKIKATVPMNADVLAESDKPSQGSFRSDVSAQMLQIVSFLNQNGCPYTVNIYPFISYATNKDFPENYAYFDSNIAQITDGDKVYTNTFDASYDTLVQALAVAGFPNMPIIVGEIGWATDGLPAATPANAQRFNQGFLNHVKDNKGTPLRPNTAIEYYLFGLLDEDNKDTAPGIFERHWGIFTFDGNAKYPLTVPGSPTNAVGDGTLVNATGVTHLPRRWCVAVANADPAKLAAPVNFACTNADCTQLTYGSSCNGLDSIGNASFAFNQYFQVQNQAAGSCSFEGLATTTTEDPSTGPCKFIVQIDPSASGAFRRVAGSARMMTAISLALSLLLLRAAPLL